MLWRKIKFYWFCERVWKF